MKNACFDFGLFCAYIDFTLFINHPHPEFNVYFGMPKAVTLKAQVENTTF